MLTTLGFVVVGTLMRDLPQLHEAAAPLATRYLNAHLTPSYLACHVAAPDVRDPDAPHHAATYALRQANNPTKPFAAEPVSRANEPADKRVGARAYSANGALELRLSTRDETLVAEVWSVSDATVPASRLARMPLAELVGAKVLPSGVFGEPRFSSDASRVVWVAERAPPPTKAPGYWPDKPADENTKASAPPHPREKHALRRGLGEALLVDESVLVVWSWRDGAIEVLTGAELRGRLPPAAALAATETRATPIHPVFDADGALVFSLVLLPERGAGISACLNRRTLLCHLQVGGEAAPPLSLIDGDSFFSGFARFSPDGSRLAYACAPRRFAGHSAALELRVLEWPAAAEARTLLTSTPTTDWTGWCGFHDEFASLRWVGPDTLALVSLSRGVMETMLVRAGSGERVSIRPPAHTGSVKLLASCAVAGAETCLLAVQCSSLTSPPTLWACRLGPGALRGRAREADDWCLLADTRRARPPPPLESLRAKILDALEHCAVTRVALSADVGGAEAHLLVPRASAAGASAPLVVRPHGGPHSMAPDAFDVQTAMLLAAGVAVLLPNYRGSLGYGQPFADALLGRIGELDVDDVAALTRKVLDDAPAAVLDEKRVAVYGGSHGGFLTAWLLAAERTRALYCGGALWNPVVDLPAMAATTDIPEWCVAEALGGFDAAWPIGTDALRRLHEASPISRVDGVRVPTLTLIGAADARVPPSQGREWVAALESRRGGDSADSELGSVEALEYMGEGHAIAGAASNAHAVQSALQWLCRLLAVV